MEYFKDGKDEGDKVVVDYGQPGFLLRRFQLTEFLTRKQICTHLIDCYGYFLNRTEAENGRIR
ncbi:hypothetical protein LINPERPRIM_LOCUS16767 [Linum perenne]